MRPMAWAVSNDVYLAKSKDQSEKRSQSGLVKNSGDLESPSLVCRQEHFMVPLRVTY
jgi:hypothetical protein